MFESLKLYVGQAINRDEIIEQLNNYGYQRYDKVSHPGDFSQRGGIIDIYPVTFECPVRIELFQDTIESIRSFNILSGESISSHTMVILLPKKVISSHRIRKPLVEINNEVPIYNFIDLEIGDYVVHIQHGIGKYLGIEKLRREERYKDYIVIEYAQGDRLYVPCEQMFLIQKYIGFEGRAPKLYRLGTEEWQRIKEKTKNGIYHKALDLLELQAMRMHIHGFVFSPDTDWQYRFESSFPYEETPDQISSTQEVKTDMESPKSMDRLLCGDVGYGKTEVALRAAFKAVMDNKQVAILVPTTILAEQHYQTFTSRLKEFPINVQMLSRFKTKREQESILQGLRDGRVDVAIGTHRLLSNDVKFKDLGLVIIDEEQRFGVLHKEKLKQLRLLVDVLTLTATPIPRTLYMSLMGIKDISIISTPPEDRIPIQTHVVEYSDELIKQAIIREMERRGQIYFVHDRVLGIDKIKDKISKLISNVRIAVGHGQMPPRCLEEVMLKFIKGQIDILVCTTIIESGIDIPNANTLIVNNAQDFGLADLHQLRGRVGRFKNKAYAYFLIPKGYVLTKESEKRLRAIEKFTELGAGFKIAMEDLEIRGAGNLLGVEQHGYIMAVGFDLYCRLLRDAVKELNEYRPR